MPDYGQKSGISHAGRSAFWSRRAGNYIVGNNSATSDITNGDQDGAVMLQAEGFTTFNMTIPEPPRIQAVGDGATLATIIGAITDVIGGNKGYVVLDQDLAAATDGRKLYTRGSDVVLGTNVSKVVQNDLAFVVNQQAKNRTTAVGSLNDSVWLVREFLLVNATGQFAPISGTAYDPNEHPYSLVFNETNRDLFGTELTVANYGYANNLVLSYYSPAPVVYQTWVGDGTETVFNINSAYVPIEAAANAVQVAVNGAVQAYTTNYTVSGQAITFGTAPADGAIITAHVKYQA